MHDQHTDRLDVAAKVPPLDATAEVPKAPQGQQGPPSPLSQRIDCLLDQMTAHVEHLRDIVGGMRKAHQRPWPIEETLEWVALSDFDNRCKLLMSMMTEAVTLLMWEDLKTAADQLVATLRGRDEADAIPVKRLWIFALGIRDAVYRLMPKFPAETQQVNEVPF